MKAAAAFVIASMGLGLLPLAFVSAQDPPANPHGHLALDCASCHTPEGWRPLRDPLDFEHGTTGFPLLAAHARADCRSCHQSLVFAHVGTACADCHRDPHRGELGPLCETCHESPRTWSNQREMFRVHNRTRFPLLAAHASVECAGCHGGQRAQEFAATPTECVACHQRDFEAARSPDHVRAGFSRQCETCHRVTARSWLGSASFAHPATFPLRGAHARVSCGQCHTAGPFAGAPRECVGCHRADFDGATDPNHRAASFSTTCESCHTEAGWSPAAFDHALARFPLTGAHARAPCSGCHQGQFRGTPQECVACHRQDYDATANPNHRSAGFPTRCQECHGTAAWRPADFDHDARFFPINSGRHRGTWASCSTCHVSPGSFAVFACVNCHEHNREEMNDKHDDVRGYEYRSPACYRCHPRGTER